MYPRKIVSFPNDIANHFEGSCIVDEQQYEFIDIYIHNRHALWNQHNKYNKLGNNL